MAGGRGTTPAARMSAAGTPMQGGLPPAGAVAGQVVEIACDESGFSGSNLLDPATPVITHASVDLRPDEAVELLARLRSGFRLPPAELKSGTFLRGPGAGDAREWFLAALAGRAHVHVVDKQLFLATRVVDLLLAEPSYAAGTRLTADRRPAALALYEAGRSAGPGWHAFLAAFVELLRTKRRRPDERTLQRFLATRDALAREGGEGGRAVLAALDPDRVRDVVARLHGDDRSIPPPLEPLLPALAETVLSWSDDGSDSGRRVLVVHDEQSALTPDRLSRLQDALAVAGGPSPLVGLVMADSRADPRVQVADLLAGTARRSWPTAAAAALRPLLTPPSLASE